MRTSFLIVVPCILLAGLLFGIFKLKTFLPSNAPCSLGTCPLAIHESDAGKTFVYSPGARFSLFLDEDAHPRDQLLCAPEGVAALLSVADSAPPIYKASFEAVAPGTCALSNKDFSATIVIQ